MKLWDLDLTLPRAQSFPNIFSNRMIVFAAENKIFTKKYVVPGDGRVRDGCPQQQNRQTEAVCSINRYIYHVCVMKI